MSNTSVKATVAIPARLGSTRLPGKVLLDLGGKPVVQHVWERVCKMKNAARVVILADTEEVRSAATAFGAEVIMTSPECRSGTERLSLQQQSDRRSFGYYQALLLSLNSCFRSSDTSTNS